MSYIQIKDLRKTFTFHGESLEVLKGVNLEIEKGDIYGIVGFSGAGKSTLARCINRLEEPTSGKIIIDGTDITALTKKQLNEQRRKIGMIFQTFNLFDSKTVYGNIAYPLKIARTGLGANPNLLDSATVYGNVAQPLKIYKTPKKQIDARVREILDLVGLSDKIGAFPAQLSGGQKQRVGIARALANNPSVLLSDEATSALDPQTTLSVLELLKEINKKLGLTIIMITHELEAVQFACNNMAVIEDGVIVEQGTVSDMFTNPLSHTGKIFLKVQTEFQQKQGIVSEGAGI